MNKFIITFLGLLILLPIIGFGFVQSTNAIDPEPTLPEISPQIVYGNLIRDNTTLTFIGATGLDSTKTYAFRLMGKFNDRDYLEGVNDRNWFEPVQNADGDWIINVGSICENGEGERGNCEKEWESGTYNIQLVTVELKSDLLDKVIDSVTAVITTESFNVGANGSITPLPEESVAVVTGPVELGGDAVTPSKGVSVAILNFGLGVGGGLAFLLMVFGAYRLIFAGGNPDSIQQGKEVITSAIAGLIVIVFAVFILRFLGFTILGLGSL